MKKILLAIAIILSFRPGCSNAQAPAFSVALVPDSVWELMQGKSYQANPHIGRDDLRYLRVLHCDYDGQTHIGEMVCNKVIADRLIAVFRRLYELHYPIERMQLPDVYDADDETQMTANNTSCFCYRPISGSGKLSKHALGLAVDINPLYNPYHKKRGDGSLFVQPAVALQYCDRSLSFPYKIERGDSCYQLFRSEGFVWGGDWRSVKDYQHFEFSGSSR